MYGPLKLLYDGTHPGTIVMNVIWTCFNITVLGVATAVAWESQQRRQTVRVAMSVPADVVLADGTVVQGVTADLSSGGVMMHIDRSFTALPGESVQLVFPVLDGDATLPATVISANGGSLRAQFDPLTLQEEEALTMVLYSRADTWLGWGEAREADRPLTSLGRIFQLSFYGLSQTIRGLMKPKKKKSPPKGRLATNVAPLILFALALAGFAGTAWRSAKAQVVEAQTAGSAAGGGLASSATTAALRADGGVNVRPVAPGNFDNQFTLADVNVPDDIVLRGVDSYHSVFFSVPQTEVVKTAVMHIRYHFSPGLLPDISHLKVSLNGTLFATLPVTTRPAYVAPGGDITPEQKLAEQSSLNIARNEQGALLEATLVMPAEMLVHNNELTFEFIGHYTFQCEDPSHSTLWSHVDNSSTIELAGSLLPLQNDLSLLPLPFYDSAVNLHPSIPIVFLSQPTPQALKAAGIIASYFGILTDYRPVHFPVSIGTIPAGNAIVIGESISQLPANLNIASASGPTVAMMTNPGDPYSKLLVVTGDTPDELVQAAQGLVLTHGDVYQGPVAQIHPPSKLPTRVADDAPRWLSTEHVTTIGDLTPNQGDLQGDGSVPVNVYMRIPPDLYLDPVTELSYHMDYRYNGIPLANESSLQVYVNTGYVSSTPMPHTERGSAVLSTIVPIPTYDMRPFSNTIAHKFVFQIAKKGKCQDTAPLNLQGAILKGLLPGYPGDPPLGDLAEPGAVCECGLSVYPAGGPFGYGGCASGCAHRGRDRDVPDVHGALRRADRLPGAERIGDERRRHEVRQLEGLHRDGHGRRSAGSDQAAEVAAGADRFQQRIAGAGYARLLRSAATGLVEGAQLRPRADQPTGDGGRLAGRADRGTGVAERVQAFGCRDCFARSLRRAEVPERLPEDLAVVAHLAVGERAAWGRLHVVPHRQRRLPRGFALVVDPVEDDLDAVLLARCSRSLYRLRADRCDYACEPAAPGKIAAPGQRLTVFNRRNKELVSVRFKDEDGQ